MIGTATDAISTMNADLTQMFVKDMGGSDRAATIAGIASGIATSYASYKILGNSLYNSVTEVNGINGGIADDLIEGGSDIIIYGSEDIAKYQYNMIENPGPLADIADNPARNFYGGRYNVEVLTEDRIYYRGGNSQNPLGQWFTTEAPESVAKIRIDTAVKPQWIDPATGELLGESVVDTAYAIKIPKGTTVYTGPIGPQGGVYCGGYDIMQTYIETPWKVDGIEVIGKYTLK